MHGRHLTPARSIDWSAHDSRPGSLRVHVGDWPTGVYYVRLGDDTGRVGEHRVAVLLPTNTWAAYNFEDENGNGWGDTWYAGWVIMKAKLGRHYQGWGMPPVFR